MSAKVNDGKTAKQRYDEKFSMIGVKVTHEKAQEIRENAALHELSITQFMVKCYEYFMNYGDVTKL